MDIKFKEGYYYKVKFYHSIWLFRFIRLNKAGYGNSLMTSGYIIDNYHSYVPREGFNIEECDIYEEIDFSEIQPFLPINHPEIIENRKAKIELLLSI